MCNRTKKAGSENGEQCVRDWDSLRNFTIEIECYIQRRESSGELFSHVGRVNEREREIFYLGKDFEGRKQAGLRGKTK